MALPGRQRREVIGPVPSIVRQDIELEEAA
jgi:hypothetical protein